MYIRACLCTYITEGTIEGDDEINRRGKGKERKDKTAAISLSSVLVRAFSSLSSRILATQERKKKKNLRISVDQQRNMFSDEKPRQR